MLSCASIANSAALHCHSNETRAPIANPPNSAQLGGTPYYSSELHPALCCSVGMRPRTGTQTETRVTNIHFASSIYDSREM